MSSIEDKYSQSENSFKINFETHFPGYYSNKWENLFFYSNGFLNNFCNDKSIINYLKKPPESDIEIIEKFKSRFENYDEVMIASLEIMKEYIDELSSPHKSGSTMQDPLITPQDAELMKQHPEMIKDLQTFRVYLNKKLRERGL